MDDFFTTAAAHRGGYLLRPDLLQLGVTDSQIKAALRAGVIVRLRSGTYAPRGHTELSDADRYRLLCFAVQDKLPSDVVLSHHSASVIHSGMTYGFDLTKVHITRLGTTTARAEAGIVHHGGLLPESDVIEVAGHRLVVPARAALESTSLAGVEAGMIQMSGMLSHGLDREELAERLARMAHWPGIAKVRLAVLWSEPEFESPGEVRSMYAFRMGGLPIPRLQVELVGHDGRSVGRVDFDWEDYWHCGEFDGLFKYGRLNPYSAENLGQSVVDEKIREDRVRALPRGMSRWIWSDFNAPAALCARLRAAMERSRRAYGPPLRTVIV